MRHVKSNVNILKSTQNKIQTNKQTNLKPSQSNNNLKNPINKNLKISEQEMKIINNQNNFLLNLCEKTSKSSFSSLVFNNNNNYKTIINSFSPNKINSFNKNNKANAKTIFNTNTCNNYIENNNNNNTNRGISIRLNFKNKIINNNFTRKNRVKKSIKKPAYNTPKNININSNYKSEFNLNEKIKEKDKQITILQKDLLQSQKLLNQLQEEKQNEISSTYNSIKRVDSFINNNINNNSYLNNNSINTNYNGMKKYSSLSNFFVSKTDKNLNILRTFYGKSKLISNKSNSKRSIYNPNYTINYNNSTNKNRIKNVARKKNNLNIFTNPSSFAKFHIFNSNCINKNRICKTRNNIHKNHNNYHNFNSGSNSNIKKKNKNFIRALSCSPNKILAQFLNQYESINCKTVKNTFRKNINIKSTSPSSAQNRFNNKRIQKIINKDKKKRNKDLDYIINKGEDLKNRMKNLLYNYISLTNEIKKKYINTEIK